MNRDFFLPRLTPSKARQMVMASKCTNAHLSRDIIACAEEDRLDIGLNDTETDIAQFIVDYNHRCVIPYDRGADLVRRALARVIPKDRDVLFVTTDPVLWVRAMGEKIVPFSERETSRLQHLTVRDLDPVTLTRCARGRYVVANFGQEHIGYEWMGKLFPELVIYAPVPDQLILPIGAKFGSLHKHLGSIVYPQIVNVIGSDKNLKTAGNAILPLIGCYNGLLVERKKKNGFNLKKYNEDDLDDDLGDWKVTVTVE